MGFLYEDPKALRARTQRNQTPRVEDSHKPALAQEGSETSKMAAREIEPIRGRVKVLVYNTIRDAGGCSDEEGARISGLSLNTYRPRRFELQEAGWIKQSGRRTITRSGRYAETYVVVER